ncbi:hypothetical protein I6F16_34120 [Bradyrhizobium sp. IC4060]|nr:hypothetical protein [Bradyrhizobium sp. IC4060]MCA1488444.1 hypothetical protein [Bradyrhizobium sp. IC4061]
MPISTMHERPKVFESQHLGHQPVSAICLGSRTKITGGGNEGKSLRDVTTTTTQVFCCPATVLTKLNASAMRWLTA